MPRARLSLDLPSEVKDRLERLRVATGATTQTEVIRRALALLDVTAEHQLKGGAILFRLPDGTEQKLLLL